MQAGSRGTAALICALAFTLASAAAAQPGDEESGLDALRSRDAGVVAEAIHDQVRRGAAAIPALKAALDDGDPVFRGHVRSALARITGQWGWDDNLIWKRSVEEAVNLDRPILVLHLFGRFDEEFC